MIRTIILAGLVSLLSGSAQAQQLLLSRYTYESHNSLVGTISAPGGSVSEITISGPQAGLFKITPAHELVFKKKPKTQDRYTLRLEAQTPRGKVSQQVLLIPDRFHPNGVIAHRGAWKHTQAPQNSLASLRQAVKLHCYGSEFDVHMSADSGLFINHDPQLQGLALEKATTAELSALRLSNGEALPTLEAYLTEGMKQTGTKLILEIKTSTLGKERSMALTERVVSTVYALKAQAWVEYIAFDYDVCKKVRALDPYAKVAYLMGDRPPEQLASDHLSGLDYHFKVMEGKSTYFSQAQALGLTVNVWTVNEAALMQTLLEQKADFITTDEPELLLEIKKASSR